MIMVYQLYKQYTVASLIKTDIHDGMITLYFHVIDDYYIVVTQFSILITIDLQFGSMIQGIITHYPILSDMRVSRDMSYRIRVNSNIVCMTNFRHLINKISRINPRDAYDCYKAYDIFVNRSMEERIYYRDLENYSDLIACLEDW